MTLWMGAVPHARRFWGTFPACVCCLMSCQKIPKSIGSFNLEGHRGHRSLIHCILSNIDYAHYVYMYIYIYTYYMLFMCHRPCMIDDTHYVLHIYIYYFISKPSNFWVPNFDSEGTCHVWTKALGWKLNMERMQSSHPSSFCDLLYELSILENSAFTQSDCRKVVDCSSRPHVPKYYSHDSCKSPSGLTSSHSQKYSRPPCPLPPRYSLGDISPMFLYRSPVMKEARNMYTCW